MITIKQSYLAAVAIDVVWQNKVTLSRLDVTYGGLEMHVNQLEMPIKLNTKKVQYTKKKKQPATS